MNASVHNSDSIAGSHTGDPVDLDISDLIALRTAHLQSEPDTGEQHVHFPGQRPSSRRGQGLEFEDLREYTPGDDLRFIDWNVTARTSRLHTRLYRDERERTTTVIVDLRSCMFTGTEALKARRAVSDAARVIWNTVSKGDRCSAIVFDDSTVEASRPLRGEAGAINACQLLVSCYQKRLTQSTTPSTIEPNGFIRLFQLLLSAGRLSGYCFVFSSADHLEQVEDKCLQEVSAKGQMAWIVLLDPVETSGLPAGGYHYRSSSPLYKSLSATVSKNNTTELKEALAGQVAKRLSLLESLALPVLVMDSVESDRYITANLAALSLI